MQIDTEQLFENARSHNGFTTEPIPDQTLHQLYELMKWGPTSANSCPARIVFVTSPAAKERLLACVNRGNAEKTRQAPVAAIVGMDLAFYDKLPQLSPHNNARSWFVDKPAEVIATNALRNSSLQGGYFIMAARTLGLDCGPMSGFNAQQVDGAFWAGTSVKTNFVCCLGHGVTTKLHPRGPRLSFDEACRIA